MRRRVQLLVIATTSAVVLAFVIPLCLLIRQSAEDRALAAAENQARSVALLVATLPEDQFDGVLAGLDSGSSPGTQVLTASGRQLGTGPDMREDPDVARALEGSGQRLVDDSGGVVVLPVVTGEGTAVVRTTVSADELHRGVTAAWLSIGALALVLVALGVAVATWLGRRISAPLYSVVDTAEQITAGDLSARARASGTDETRALADALNDLAARTAELLATERAAVGDLSHRLRTPVTALRLDAESVVDEELSRRLSEHIAVLQRTIDAIVSDARRPITADLPRGSNAREVLLERLDFWLPLAEDQDRHVDRRITDVDLGVALETSALVDLIDVLIDNVFAHTPEGVPWQIELRGSEQPDGRNVAELRVSDAGPGLGTDGAAREGTSGLGLDLVRRLAEGVEGSVRLGSAPEGGAEVVVRLPLQTAPR